jgi:hypothetical protein
MYGTMGPRRMPPEGVPVISEVIVMANESDYATGNPSCS